MDALIRGVKNAGVLAGVAIVCGVLAGWWGILRADGPEAMATQSGPLYILLALILPLTLVAVVFMNQSDEDQTYYHNVSGTRIQFVVTGLLGSILGSGLFIVGVFQISSVFGGEDPTEMMTALRPYLFENAILVIGVTTIAGFIVAQWAHLRVTRRTD